MKRTFLLYSEKYEAIKLLSREQKGDLLDAIYSYARDEELPEMDTFTSAMFILVRQGMDETAEKYARTIEKRKEAGKKGGLASGVSRRGEANASNYEANEANASIVKQTEANASNYEANEDDTVTVTETVTGTVTETDTGTETETEVPYGNHVIRAVKPPKHKYGEYQHVLLTDEEHNRLSDEYGDRDTANCIRFLDEYIEEKGYKSKSHYLAIKRWAMEASKEKTKGKASETGNQFLKYLKENGAL